MSWYLVLTFSYSELLTAHCSWMLKPNINFLIPTHTCQGVPLPFLTHAASSPFSILVQPQPMPPSSLAFFSHVAFLPSTKPPKIQDPLTEPKNPCHQIHALHFSLWLNPKSLKKPKLLPTISNKATDDAKDKNHQIFHLSFSPNLSSWVCDLWWLWVGL